MALFRPELRAFLKERRLRKQGDYGSGIETPQWEAWLPYLVKSVRETMAIDLENRFEQIRFPQLARVLALQKIDALSNPADAQKTEEQKQTLIQRLKKIASIFCSANTRAN